MQKHAAAPTILRRPQVAAKTGLSLSTINSLILRGEFPAPFALTGLRSVGWLERDIDQWITDRAARVPIAPSGAATLAGVHA